MTEADVWAAFSLVLFVGSAAFGLRGTRRVFRRYRAASAHDALTPPERLLLRTLVAVCAITTTAALLIGGLSVRRLIGFEALGFLAPLTFVVSIAVLNLGGIIDLVVQRIAKWEL